MTLDSFNMDRHPGDMPGDALPRLGEKLAVLLYQPEIPQNTGNIARTCAATHVPLYLVGPLGFQITDSKLKRAGLDYWPYAQVKLYADFDAAHADLRPLRLIYFSARADRLYFDFRFQPGDCLVFGPETRGLPEELVVRHPGDMLKAPIDRTRVRSLNLATTVGIALFEALRQLRGLGIQLQPARAPEAPAAL